MELRSFPVPIVWTAGELSSEMSVSPRLQMRGLETIYQQPDPTVGVLMVSLKGSEYSSRFMCTRCSLMDRTSPACSPEKGRVRAGPRRVFMDRVAMEQRHPRYSGRRTKSNISYINTPSRLLFFSVERRRNRKQQEKEAWENHHRRRSQNSQTLG